MLMPSHAKIVQPYREPQPLFAKSGVEAQLDAMFSNDVTLKSGGYLVINPTEALVSIDVNSGRSTREHNIEDTALKTNLEAAEEIARQLRLRDLAGLIVIDFIDMEEKRNNRSVEKKLNECLKNDRARIQVGRISPFGLLEMSRQRIRTGVLESSSIPCPHCAGTGFVRSTPSVALHVLRSIEETLIKSASHNLVVRTRMEAAFYILNQKRVHLRELETRFGVADHHRRRRGLHRHHDLRHRARRARPQHRAQGGGHRRPDRRHAPAESTTPRSSPRSRRRSRTTRRKPAEASAPSRPAKARTRTRTGDGNGRRRRRRRRRRGRDATGTAHRQIRTEGAPESDEEDGEDERRGERGPGGAARASLPRPPTSVARPPPSPRPPRRPRPRA